MKSKGFTLVEVLGVIMILSALVVIVFPGVINSVKNKSKDVDETTESLVLSAAKLYVSENSSSFKERRKNVYCVSLSELKEKEYLTLPVEMQYTKEDITDKKTVRITYNIGFNYELVNNNECTPYELYYDPLLNGSDPDLMDGLTPVKYDEENKSWVIANPTEIWYDYENQEWANAVILSENGKNKHEGDSLKLPTTNNDFNSSDVLAMFVWIPRFSYTIKSQYGVRLDGGSKPSQSTPGAIDIKFVSKYIKDNGKATYDGKTPKEWYTHPAFTFGFDELSGIWVGKFETSHTTLGKSTNDLNCIDETCENADGIRILPNVQSLRNNNVSNFFFVSRSLSRDGNPFGINSSITDPHMMKNSEWGAVAYLSQSEYGKYGNSDYTGVNKEVYKNDSSSYYTGRSSGKPGVGGFSAEGTCKYYEEKPTSEQSRTEGTGSCGPGASTTGNVYGIYDMSGGANEFVMGNYSDIVGSSNFQETFLSIESNKKYYDKYTITTISECSNEECKGHALSETRGWYGDYTSFVSTSNPWFRRGGVYNITEGAGVFSPDCNDGGNSGNNSFRIVFAPIT